MKEVECPFLNSLPIQMCTCLFGVSLASCIRISCMTYLEVDEVRNIRTIIVHLGFYLRKT